MDADTPEKATLPPTMAGVQRAALHPEPAPRSTPREEPPLAIGFAQLDRALGSQQEALDELDDMIAKLEAQLNPLCGPPFEYPRDEPEPTGPPGGSVIAKELNHRSNVAATNASRVRNMTLALANLRERLEL